VIEGRSTVGENSTGIERPFFGIDGNGYWLLFTSGFKGTSGSSRYVGIFGDGESIFGTRRGFA